MKRGMRSFLAIVLFISMIMSNVGNVLAVENDVGTVAPESGQEELSEKSAKEEITPAEKEVVPAAEETEKVQKETPASKPEITYEDDKVTIHVTEETAGTIPEDVSLKVIPIERNSSATGDQYDEIESELWTKAGERLYTLEGFLPYDISFVDAQGYEIEPAGNVNVTMEYKHAAIPDGVHNADDTEVTVMHLEENPDGDLKTVVDMKENGQLKSLDTTGNQEVKKTEFITDSFSVYTLAWIKPGNYVDVRDAIVTGERSTVSGLGVPDHNKTIKRNGTDEQGVDNYTISLDVTGKQSEPDPIDILLVLDYSGSMKYRMGSDVNAGSVGDSRIGKVQNAITLLKQELQGLSQQTDIRFAMVEFSGPTSGGRSETSYQTSRNNGAGDASSIQNWIPYDSFTIPTASSMYNNATGGTNWQAGIRQGNTLMQGANSAAKKYVVFLTDGAPTFRYGTANGSGSSISSIDIRANDKSRTYGTGSSDDNGHNLALAKAEYTASAYLQNSAARYLVNVSTKENNCTDFANHIGARGLDGNIGYLSGANDSNLVAGFRKIIGDIVTASYSNVVIRDKLSAHVDFASTNPGIQVYAVDSAGNKTQLGTNQYTVDQALLANRIVSVKLLNGAALAQDVTYRVEFEVIPSATAITGPYRGEGYDGIGDVPGGNGVGGTDHVSNNPKFSEGQSGYWSNDNENTYLSYNENDQPQDPAPYPKPVFQVQTTKYSAVKIWEGVSEAELQALSVEIQLSAVANTDIGPVNLGSTGYMEIPPITLNNGNGWTHTWQSLPKYYYYYDASGNALHVEIQYSADEVNIPVGFDKTATETIVQDPEDSSKTIAQVQITNTKKGELTVIKNWADGAASHSGDSIYVALLKDGNPVLKGSSVTAVKLNAGNNWTAIFENLGELTGYSVKELNGVSTTARDGLTEAVLPDGTLIYYKNAVEHGGMLTLGDVDFQVSYEESSLPGDDKNKAVTITNSKKLNTIVIKKVDAADPSTTLAGAQFKLDKKDTGGNWVSVLMDNGNPYIITTVNDGKAVFTGLENATYRITEMKAPDGYTLLKEPVEVVLPYNEAASPGEEISYVEGSGVLKEDGTCYYEITMTMKNTKLYVLPESGGIGTYLFTISGVAMITAAFLLLINTRSRREEHVSH